ncbi:MAG: hypothetical protein DLM69_00920 [Candidatus Chloroheliales bacterium]|nr:MAG: hypothetical protein DLM69_00920 [Chloroflexota bacterium]
MKCDVKGCPGEYKAELLALVKHRQQQLIVIDNVPASVCDFCGQTLISPETVRQMERIKQSSALQPTTTAPVYDFAQGATMPTADELVTAGR